MARCGDCDHFKKDQRYEDCGRCDEHRKDVRAYDSACSDYE